MSLVSPTQVSDGTTADASDVNTPINQLAAVINGNIDNSNIVAGAAIDGSKLANSSIDIGAKASVFDGWVGVTDSWAYASATTVTVPSDATTKYAPGDKVKFVQTSTKYFTIQSLTSTVITFTGGSDTVANAAISNIYYSKVDTPQTFPGPANPYKFKAYRNAAYTPANSAHTKYPFDAESFDTNNNYDAATNYRYTCPVSGFYYFGGHMQSGTNSSRLLLMLYKNGAEHHRFTDDIIPTGQETHGGSTIVQATAGDYFEFWYYVVTPSAATVGSVLHNSFEGFLISRT